MHSPRGGAVWLSLAVALGCSTPAADRSDPGAPPADQPSSVARPTSLADIPPGDTLGLVRLMESLMADGDGALALSVRRDTTVPAVLVDQPRTLSLWLYDDHPVKLVASETDAEGRMTAETRVWFHGGEVSVVQAPFSLHLFDGDRLVLTTDEGMMPLEPTDQVRMQLERRIIDSVKARLAVFGVAYP
ncbi:MAG TPA: hypothetical protein VFN22_02790 [Gemmatimonadales bacterium]|nr:hypothetical protein [Gemmatimonadales bacterium]